MTATMVPVTKNTYDLGKLDLNPRLKSNSLPGRMLIIPEGDPADALACLQEQMPNRKPRLPSRPVTPPNLSQPNKTRWSVP